MSGAYVQSWETVPTNNSNSSVQVDVNTTGATAGNLLIGMVSFRYNSGTIMTGISDATGNWTEIGEGFSGLSEGAAWYYRVADGTANDDLDVDITGGALGYITGLVSEFSGLDPTPVLEDSTAPTINGAGTTCACGTATPTTIDGTAIAFLMVRKCDEWATDNEGAGITVGSYTKHFSASSASAGRPSAHIASLNYASTADQSPTWSTSDTGGRAYGAVAVFKADVAVSELTADDVESASETSSPAVGQTHALAQTGVQSASQLSSPVLGQEHALTATSVQSASEVSSPAAFTGTGLLAEDIESASEVSTPVLSSQPSVIVTWVELAITIPQIKNLTAVSVEAATEVSVPSIGMAHSLSANSVESASSVSVPRLVTWTTVNDTQTPNWGEVIT